MDYQKSIERLHSQLHLLQQEIEKNYQNIEERKSKDGHLE